MDTSAKAMLAISHTSQSSLFVKLCFRARSLWAASSIGPQDIRILHTVCGSI